jgi:hypothetical protein
MKRTLLTCFILLGMIVTSSNLLSFPSINDSLDAEEEIELIGSLPDMSTRSAICPILAFCSTSEIRVFFPCNMGDLDVVIYDETDHVVYESTVNTSTVDQLFIDISSFGEGVYEIRFISSEDRFVYGEFEID